MKIKNPLEKNKPLLVPNFEAISHVTLILESKNRPKVLRKKRRNCRQKYLHGYIP